MFIDYALQSQHSAKDAVTSRGDVVTSLRPWVGARSFLQTTDTVGRVTGSKSTERLFSGASGKENGEELRLRDRG